MAESQEQLRLGVSLDLLLVERLLAMTFVLMLLSYPWLSGPYPSFTAISYVRIDKGRPASAPAKDIVGLGSPPACVNLTGASSL